MFLMSEKYRNKKWLYKKYVIEGKTQQEIADICGVSSSPIGSWLSKFGIKDDKRYKGNNHNYRKIYEQKTNTILKSSDFIHHIDMNQNNNDVSNLCKTNKDGHRSAHGSYQKIMRRLCEKFLKIGLITFDESKGIYLLDNSNILKQFN